MSVALVLPTHNRLEYTQRTIPCLLADLDEDFELYLWDDASSDETPDFLKSLNDPRIVSVTLSREKLGPTGAMNHAWSKTRCELVGKVDNDCVVTPGWTRIFAQAHKDIPKLGAVCMWHFFMEDFDHERARHKIQTFNGHQILRHPWVAGSGFLMKRETFLKIGPWIPGHLTGTTYYFMDLARCGCINGWYYPLILQDHLDDPRHPECLIKDHITFEKYRTITYGLKSNNYDDIEGRLKRRDEIVRNLIEDPYDVAYYSPWRQRLRRLKTRISKMLPIQA